MQQIKRIVEKVLNIKEYKLYPILDVAEPLLVAMKAEAKWYLIYVLQSRYMRRVNGERTFVMEIFISETNVEIIKQMAKGDIPIRKALESENMMRIGTIGNKLYKPTIVNELSEVYHVIPKEHFKLNGMIPNRVDIDEVLEKIDKGEC